MKTLILKNTLALAVSFAAVSTNASATYQKEVFPGCDCDSPVTLVGFDFQNVAVGTMGDSVPASEVFGGFIASDIEGPGKVKIGDIAGSNWGCFGGFSANGNAGMISFDFTNYSGAEFCLSDITFDYVTEQSGKYHGPTNFRVAIFDAAGSLQWLSYKTEVTPGTSNGGSFAIAGMNGYNYAYNDDFVTIGDGQGLTIGIYAWGANSSKIGLDIDNLQVKACPPEVIPEPTTSVLAAFGAAFLLIRRKR